VSGPAPALVLSTARDAGGFAAAAPGWDELVLAMARPSPFLLHEWLGAWWRHHGAQHALQVQLAHRGDRLVGALPLFAERRRGVRVARFVGGADAALADVLVAPREDPAVAAGLAARAAGEANDLADLAGLPAGSRLAAALGPRRLALVPRADAPVLDLSGDWEAVYAARVSAKHRKAQRRNRRRLAELGTLEAALAHTPADVGRALDDAFALHALRWRDRPDGSGFASTAGSAFQREALLALAAQDVVRVATLRLDGRPLAFVAFFLLAGRMVLHRLAFDPAYARFSPGVLALHDALAAAAADGVRRVEFLGGSEPYKLALADRCEPLHEGLGLARGARGHAALAGRRAAIAARRELARRPALRRAWYDGLAPARRVHRRLRSAPARTF
jgi:CelD/BcsL family acetyltransferase involved in cellulose biosynthesis